jgi:16S rRNA (guanine527-N7)-methyltransferase
VELTQAEAYAANGLGPEALAMLSLLGDLLVDAPFNVTSIKEPEAIENFHFLDSLSLLAFPAVRSAQCVADIGSGAGLPALVLGVSLPLARITAVEAQHKKCRFIEEAAAAMALRNVEVRCLRAEDYGRLDGRAAHDVVVSRALAALPTVAEYSLPLLEQNGMMIALKGDISDQERIQAQKALAILGGGELEAVRLQPFAGAQNRWAYSVRKVKATPAPYPRRAGTPLRRPLGR